MKIDLQSVEIECKVVCIDQCIIFPVCNELNPYKNTVNKQCKSAIPTGAIY